MTTFLVAVFAFLIGFGFNWFGATAWKAASVAAERAKLEAQIELATLQEKWNTLVNRINKKGGEAFLNGGTQKALHQFSKPEIKQLIALCHPDKHGGSKIAEEVTKKLLQLRN